MGFLLEVIKQIVSVTVNFFLLLTNYVGLFTDMFQYVIQVQWYHTDNIMLQMA